MNDKKIKIAVSAIIAFAIAMLSFAAGFLTERCSSSRAVSSYEWALKTIKDNYYFGEPDASFTDTALGAISDKYLDPYSEYYTKEEYEQVIKSNQGSKSGVGISYAFVEGRGIFIGSVVGNSPAYLAGLRAGEYITRGSVEGGSEVVFDSSDSFSKFVSPIGDGVKVKLVSEDGNSFTVAKSEYTACYTSLSTATTGWTFGDSADGGLALYEQTSLRMSYLPEGCAYLRLDQFFGTAVNEFYSLVEKFNAAECTSLILDLRSNGGGYVNVMQDIAGAFADGKSMLAMLSRDKKGREDKFYCKKISDPAKRIDKSVNVFVLANAGTASASEALIGAMVCYGALDYKNIFVSQYSDAYINWLYPDGKGVKNARSYGKGIMQSSFTNFSTGEVLKLTTAKIFWPDKTTCIHDVGVTVGDGCTPLPAEWEWTKDDTELKTAVEIIKDRI